MFVLSSGLREGSSQGEALTQHSLLSLVSLVDENKAGRDSNFVKVLPKNWSVLVIGKYTFVRIKLTVESMKHEGGRRGSTKI